MVAKIKKMAAGQGGTFNGDESFGSFAGGGVEGTYTVGGGQVSITLTKGRSMRRGPT